MKLLKYLLLSCVLSIACFAQNLATITASNIQSSPGTLLSSGTMLLSATDSTGKPIGYQIGGGGQVLRAPTLCTIQNGAISSTCQVANVSLTNPQNFCFNVVIKDSFNHIVLGGDPRSGYACVQPQTNNAWCTNASCNFDAYVPNLPNIPAAVIVTPTATTLGGVYAQSCTNVVGQKFIGFDTNGKPLCATDQIGNGVFDLELESPSTADTGKFKYLGYPAPITITRITCNAMGGSVAINLESKTSTDWESAGVSLLSSPITCSDTPFDQTTISVPNVNADTPIALDIAAVSGSPSLIAVRVYFQLQ